MADKFTSGRIDTHEYLAKLAENSLTAEQIQDIINYKVQEKLGRYTHTYGHQLTIDDFYQDSEDITYLVCNLQLRNDYPEVFLIGSELKQALLTKYPNADTITFRFPDGNEYISFKTGLLLDINASGLQEKYAKWISSSGNLLYTSFISLTISEIDNVVLYWHPLSDSITIDLLAEY